MLAVINASLIAKGNRTVTFPDESMIGSLMNFISNRNQIMSSQKKNKLQPMSDSFGLIPELNKRIKDKRFRYSANQQRFLNALNIFKRKLDYFFKKDHRLIEVT